MICEGQTLPGFTNNYLHMSNPYNKVMFKIPGYKPSKALDVSTVGLSGCLELEPEKHSDI